MMKRDMVQSAYLYFFMFCFLSAVSSTVLAGLQQLEIHGLSGRQRFWLTVLISLLGCLCCRRRWLCKDERKNWRGTWFLNPPEPPEKRPFPVFTA